MIEEGSPLTPEQEIRDRENQSAEVEAVQRAGSPARNDFPSWKRRGGGGAIS